MEEKIINPVDAITNTLLMIQDKLIKIEKILDINNIRFDSQKEQIQILEGVTKDLKKFQEEAEKENEVLADDIRKINLKTAIQDENTHNKFVEFKNKLIGLTRREVHDEIRCCKECSKRVSEKLNLEKENNELRKKLERFDVLKKDILYDLKRIDEETEDEDEEDDEN